MSSAEIITGFLEWAWPLIAAQWIALGLIIGWVSHDPR